MENKQSYTILENVLVLKKSPLFVQVSTSELRAVAAVVEEMVFQEGDEIVREGDIGDSLYLIKKGKVSIQKKIGNSSSTVLAELGVGDCFGEMAAIDEEVRSASVIAGESCTLMRISKEDLMEVIIECPHIGIELLRIFIRRLRRANLKIEELAKISNSGY